MEWGQAEWQEERKGRKDGKPKGQARKAGSAGMNRRTALRPGETVNSHQEPHGCSPTLPGCKDHLPSRLEEPV